MTQNIIRYVTIFIGWSNEDYSTSYNLHQIVPEVRRKRAKKQLRFATESKVYQSGFQTDTDRTPIVMGESCIIVPKVISLLAHNNLFKINTL